MDGILCKSFRLWGTIPGFIESKLPEQVVLFYPRENQDPPAKQGLAIIAVNGGRGHSPIRVRIDNDRQGNLLEVIRCSGASGPFRLRPWERERQDEAGTDCGEHQGEGRGPAYRSAALLGGHGSSWELD